MKALLFARISADYPNFGHVLNNLQFEIFPGHWGKGLSILELLNKQ